MWGPSADPPTSSPRSQEIFLWAPTETDNKSKSTHVERNLFSGMMFPPDQIVLLISRRGENYAPGRSGKIRLTGMAREVQSKDLMERIKELLLVMQCRHRLNARGAPGR